jgi:hypothetical protein
MNTNGDSWQQFDTRYQIEFLLMPWYVSKPLDSVLPCVGD